MLLLSLIASMIGAVYTRTTVFSSLVLAVRLLIVAATLYELMRVFPILKILRALVIAMGIFVLVAAVSGAGSLASGRLSGGIPPLSPNEMTGLCGIVIVAVAWRNIEHLGRRWDVLVILGLVGIIWLTGSRTGFVALVVALAVLFLQGRKLSLGFVLAMLAAVPVLYYLLAGTSLVSHYANRGGSQNVTSLNQRTVAWTAALHLHTGFWDTWFGNGLSMVKIPVTAQFRTEQILDSSWVSALVQSGIIGVILLVLWILVALVAALRSVRHYRLLASALLAFVVSRSVLESGLIAATPIFLIFYLVSSRQLGTIDRRAVDLRTVDTRDAARRDPAGREASRRNALTTVENARIRH
jgi:O-antigen ligase